MFHMTNYTIEKEEGRRSVRVKRGELCWGGENNDKKHTGQDKFLCNKAQRGGDEIERILSLVPVPSVYINKCDRPCSLCLPISIPTVLDSA